MPSPLVEGIVSRLASRDTKRTEADLQSDIAMLLVSGELNLESADVVKRESQVGDGTRRRIDVELGHMVVEVKRDLRVRKALPEAEAQLAGYLAERENQSGAHFAGVLTDGTTWILYRLVGGTLEEVALLELSELEPDADRLIVWLESIMATRVQVKPTPDAIEELLGATSPAHALDHAVLRGLLESAASDREVQLKRELWSKLLKTAYGEAFQDDEKLFVNHTLLVITAEAIAHAIVGFDIVHGGVTVDDLVSGVQFTRSQINGVVEADFFDWPVSLQGGHDLVAEVARRVARFDWASVEHDVLKVLYESVIEQRDREALGEYYTPDWLAEEMVKDRIPKPADVRVLDPSCGSGTFIFHAVKAYLDAAEAAGLGAGEAAVGATKHVFGIDVHPVAVTLARVTYLMAIGADRLNASDRGPLTVPVFLGDSMQWERHSDLFTNEGAITIATSSEDLIAGGGGSLFEDDLVFPQVVWADSQLFDRIVNDMAQAVTKAAGQKTPTLSGIKPILNRHMITDDEDQKVLTKTYETWIGLQRQHRDRIWGYYVRNLVRPAWLARDENRVDVLIGNPPWLAFSKMPASMQTRYSELAKPRNLLKGRLGVAGRDLSTVFVARSVELYLRDGGTFGFVMPFGTLSRKSHAGFRAGDWRNPDTDAVTVQFDTPWDLSKIKKLFPMTSCVVRGQLIYNNPRVMPSSTIKWVGPRNGVRAAEAGRGEVAIAGTDSASTYARMFRQGAILVPRMALFVERLPSGPLGAGAGRTEVKSARSSQEKPPYKQMPGLQGVVEDHLIREVHLGETIAPYRPLTPRKAVLPLNPNGIMTESEVAGLEAFGEWWSNVEDVWERGRKPAETLPLLERMNYHQQLSSQLPLKPNRVVYTKAGNTLAAARIPSDSEAVIDHKLYWAACPSVEEARYLVAILNSRALLDTVSKYQTVGLFGPRDFDKYVFEVGFPAYDATSAAHTTLVKLSERAEAVAEAVALPPGVRFVRARKAVVASLKSDGVWQEIEEAVTGLLPEPTQGDAI